MVVAEERRVVTVLILLAITASLLAAEQAVKLK
jgi:hypothetical protein